MSFYIKKKNSSTSEMCFMNYEIRWKVEMFEESGDGFYYQKKTDIQACCWVTVDLRPPGMAMWPWPQGHWWHFKAVLCCLFFSRDGQPEPGYKRACYSGLCNNLSEGSCVKNFCWHILGDIICHRKKCIWFVTAPRGPSSLSGSSIKASWLKCLRSWEIWL